MAILERFSFFLTFLTLRYFFFAGIAFFVLYVWQKDRFSRFKLQDYRLKPGQISREIRYSFLSTLFFAFSGLYLFVLKSMGFGRFYENISDRGVMYYVVSVLFFLFLYDAFFYWTHRWLHNPRLFRTIHWLHHESRNTTPWTAISFHPIEGLMNAVFVLPLPFLIPLHISTVPAFGTLAFILSVYAHSGFEIVPESWMKRRFLGLLFPSREHNFHHEKINKNFGLYFSWWDRWFGTLRDLP